MKSQKLTYLGQMTGWTEIDIRTTLSYKDFVLTLTGGARLLYESLRPLNVDWLSLQNIFRQQHSKIDNTREQLFYAWRSFHFDENTERWTVV